MPHADLKVLDFHQTTATITIMHAGLVYDQLFNWDENMVGRPQMVEAYTVSPDKLKYTFTLRPGLKFHDGSAVTTKDVIASVKRMLAKDTQVGKLAEFTQSIDRVDDRTFTITLKEPFGFVEFALGGGNNLIGIMREKEALTDPNQPVTEPIGSGPFVFNKAEWQPGAKVIYDKNKDYVPRSEPPSGFSGGKVVKVDRVEYVVIPEASTKFAAIQRGEVDMLDQPPMDLLNTIEKSPDIVIGDVIPLGIYGVMRPNSLHPPFNNVKARQALAYMMDQKEYIAAAFGDPRYSQVCYAAWICGSPNGTEAGSEPYQKPDIAKARQLMQESGYKGEKVVVIGTTEIPQISAMGTVTVERLKAIGVNVEYAVTDWGNVVTRRAKKDPPEQGGWNIFHTTGGGAPLASPLLSTITTMTCDGKNWFGWPCDEQYEKLRNDYIHETDAGKQKQLVEAMHRRIWEVMPFVLTGQYNQKWVWRKNVFGVLKTQNIVFWNIDKS